MTPAILVIEDDSTLRDVLTEVLVSEGYDVVTSNFAPLPDGEFAVVLSDVPLWPYDDDSTRRWVASLRERYSGTRIIMLCTEPYLLDRHGDPLGSDVVVIDRPFNLADLFARLSELIGSPATGRRLGMFATSVH